MIVRHFKLKLLGLLLFASACAVVFIRLFTIAGGDVIADRYQVDVPVPTAISLVPGSEVRTAGIQVGRVERVSNRGSSAIVRIGLEREHAPIHRDAVVKVRTKTLVGENYLELRPGTPGSEEVPDGGALALANAEPTTQLDEIISTFDPRTRRAMRRALAGMGDGLRGQGEEFNKLIAGAAGAFEAGKPVLSTLSEYRAQAATLVEDTAALAQRLASRTEDLRELVRTGRRTAEAVAAHDGALRDLLDALPGALRSTRLAVGSLSALGAGGTPVVGDLTAGAAELAPAVDRLPRAARRTSRLLRELDRLTDAGVPMVDELEAFAGEAKPLVRALTPALRHLDPMLEYAAPYHREIGAIFGNLASGVGSSDAIGYLGRVHAIVDEATYAGYTGELRRAVDALFDLGILSKLRTKGTNNYPAPGTLLNPTQFEGRYPRIYPRGWQRP